ncbi:MAG: ABC transporter permease [Thermoplasmata archaeon]|nr:ABC transporter permease [Thermoplasmata archaeon]MCI4356358.1 ABC transporter permease [Thermoplasmata archaeon]
MSGATRSFSRGRVVAAVLGGSLLLLFVVPIVALLTFAPPSQILDAANQSGVRAAFSFTALASTFALAITLLLGVPLGYLLAGRSFPGRSVVEAFVTLPVVVPHLIAGLALFFLFAPNAPLGRAAIAAGFPVLSTIGGVVLVMVYVSAPYTVVASQLAFRSVDERLVEAARSLGASPSATFLRVTLPLALRGIVAGGVLSWARSVSEIGGFLIVAYVVYPSPFYNGPVTTPASVYIYNLYQIGDTTGAASVASLFVLGALALFVVVRALERSGRLPWVGRRLPG